jgi:hypothetical protein
MNPTRTLACEWVTAEQTRAIKEWRREFRAEPSARMDVLTTDEDIAEHNLILWGDPQTNSVLGASPTNCPSAGPRRRSRCASRPSRRQARRPLDLPQPAEPETLRALNSGFTFRE